MSEEITIPEEHNEHYKSVLEQTKKTGNNTAEKRIPELYWILRNEEGKSPLDAKDQVKQDLIDTFSRVTMDRHFPDEAKDEEKARAAKIRWERKQQKSASEQDTETDSVEQKGEESQTLPPISVAIGGTQETEADEDLINKNVPVVDSEEFFKKQTPDVKPNTELLNEEPTELELANIRIAQLEDALRQTQQFKPATQIQEEPKPIEVYREEHYFNWLKEKSNGTSCFWYDSYGIDLFKNRELSQLKNSGVKSFKRLYFEV